MEKGRRSESPDTRCRSWSHVTIKFIYVVGCRVENLDVCNLEARPIKLWALLALVVLFFIGCTQQELEAPPQTVPTQGQATPAADLNRPNVVRLRGILRDNEGKRVTSVAGVLFAVYELPEDGAPLWQEVQNIKVDDRGNFTVFVGSTTKEGIPAEFFAKGKTYWLGKQLLLPGEIEQPRIRLVRPPVGARLRRP